ncbi:hypothetical protein HDC94_000923 [Leifsonia sp. AK011]|uniref:hypothetical protein n=1 Tax=Leifsonia sp. AK011 TaxID=2723075 RepID=UPI0015C6C8B7|nr:hypothetical protein [Leifsonia sp. AK011]NYF09767.1 hypothetical protein [Leifsonia sp. AK011]
MDDDHAARADHGGKKQRALWRALRYSWIDGWSGHVGEPWDEEWSTEVLQSAPFTYLNWLTAESHFGGRLAILAHIESGLYIEPGLSSNEGELLVPDASLESLPTGLVERLELHLESGSGYCVEVLLTIAGRPLLIVAGDVVEGQVRWLDEELLVFEQPSDAARVPWRDPRDFHVLEID